MVYLIQWNLYINRMVTLWDTFTSWLLYRGGTAYRSGLLYIVNHPWDNNTVGCYITIQRWSAYTVEPVYSGHPWDTTSWLLYGGRSAYTVEPVYSGHLWDTTSWLLYRGGLLIQWNLYIAVTLGTQPVGCYIEVACLYSGTCI